MRYTFSICHTPGKELITADALSRAPVDPPAPDDNEVNAFVDVIMSSLPASPSKLDQIKALYDQDTLCANVIKYCKSGWPEKSEIPTQLKMIWEVRGDFTVQNGLLLKETRLVIPNSL